MTTIYLIRHSKPLKVNHALNTDDLQIQNEKSSLSIEGEELAKEKLTNKELNNTNVLYASNYVRAIQTAKYLAEKEHLEINIVSDFGERKFGIRSYEELPEGFETKQFLEETYKIGNGENQKEVRERMYHALMSVLEKNEDQKIIIVSHATAMCYLLKTWCGTKLEEDNSINFYYKEKLLFQTSSFRYCEAFKLEFDQKELINLEHIEL